MNRQDVSTLIESIPHGLTPDDFLVALANKAAEAGAKARMDHCLDVLLRLHKESIRWHSYYLHAALQISKIDGHGANKIDLFVENLKDYK